MALATLHLVVFWEAKDDQRSGVETGAYWDQQTLKTAVIQWTDTGLGIFSYTQTMECVRMEVASGRYMESQPVFQTQGQPYAF